MARNSTLFLHTEMMAKTTTTMDEVAFVLSRQGTPDQEELFQQPTLALQFEETARK
jgi:hypothetical protein